MKKKLFKSKEKKKGGEVFGVPLTVTATYDEKTSSYHLPAVVTHSILRIAACKKEEGIFRLSGKANAITELKEAYDNKQPVDLSKVDSNVCCGLLKLYLREMPEPLFPARLYKAFVYFQGMRTEGVKGG